MTFTSCPNCFDFTFFPFLPIVPLTSTCAHSTNVVLTSEFPCFVILKRLFFSPLESSPGVSPQKDAKAGAVGNLLKSDTSTCKVIAAVVSIPLKQRNSPIFSLYESF